MTITLREATTADVSRIVEVVNAAYVVEEEFRLKGKRTDEDDVATHMRSGAFLVAESDGAIAGCVYVEANDAGGYFGMLSVDPVRQYGGLGKQLVAAAERWCIERDCAEMTITVVNARQVLFPWYEKLGYVDVGREPFPQPERMTIPVEMVVMRKTLAPVQAIQGVRHG